MRRARTWLSVRASNARQRRQQLQQSNDLPVLDDAHVLMITVDALRADHLGLHGYGRGVTRELDALGARGVVFDNAYAQAPHSSYSLCSLMTSEYLHETLELGQTPPQATLPRLLTAAGYHTAAFYTLGIFHTAGEQLAAYEEDAFGFALHDHQDRPAEQMTDRVLAEIDRTVARGEPSSLFWVHYFDVHEPYEATTLGTSDMDRYDSELLATDRAIGRLVRSAEQRLKKPLVIVVTADHGEEFHEHGGVYHGSSLYQEQVHVPLIFVAPGVSAARRAAPVESIDITPTLLALLGVERAPSMRGIDLRPAFLGRASERPVFSAVIHKKMAVSWPYKLIADLRFGSFELYDLARDPGERDNQADRDPRRLRSLRGEIYAWLDSPRTDAPATRAGHDLALEWGGLGDRRAVAPLASLLLDEHAPSATRSEAARLLGKLADEAASESLFAATHASDAWVAAEAAIALGRMFDPRAARMLRRLVVSEDPGVRSRAAVSLGRLRDPAAVPPLGSMRCGSRRIRYEREGSGALARSSARCARARSVDEPAAGNAHASSGRGRAGRARRPASLCAAQPRPGLGPQHQCARRRRARARRCRATPAASLDVVAAGFEDPRAAQHGRIAGASARARAQTHRGLGSRCSQQRQHQRLRALFQRALASRLGFSASHLLHDRARTRSAAFERAE